MRKHQDHGFTVIEFLIVIVILVIMMAVAIPGFQTFMANRRLGGAVSQVGNDLRYVQSVAAKRGGFARLHWGNDPAEGRTGQYRLEWRADGAAAWTALGQWYALTRDYEGASISSLKASSGNTVYEVVFNSQGGAAEIAGVTYPITVTVAADAGSRDIQVFFSGNVRLP